MIVCICRNLSQNRVLQAIEAGAAEPHEVHSACGVEVNCGCCLETIEDMICGARYTMSQAAE